MGIKLRSPRYNDELANGEWIKRWRSPIAFDNAQNNRSSKSKYWLTVIGVLVLGLIVGYLAGYQHGWHNGYNGVGMAGIGGMFQSLSGVIKIVVILVIIAVLLWLYSAMMSDLSKKRFKLALFVGAIIVMALFVPKLPSWLIFVSVAGFIVVNLVIFVRWANDEQKRLKPEHNEQDHHDEEHGHTSVLPAQA